MSEPLDDESIDFIIDDLTKMLFEILRTRVLYKDLKEKIKFQKLEEDDYVHDELRNFLRESKQPEQSKYFEINDVKIKVTKTHRKEAETVYGVDFIYEIEDEKFVLVQFKKVSADSRLYVNTDQLKDLRKFCNRRCTALKHENKESFADTYRLMPFCPCYYNIILNGEEIVLPACIIEAILRKKGRTRKSAEVDEFRRGFARETFIDLFSKCWIGPIDLSEPNVANLIDHLLAYDHIIVHGLENPENST